MIFLILLCLAVAPSEQLDITVDCNNGNDTLCKQSDYTTPCKTLQAALDAVADNDTIHNDAIHIAINGSCLHNTNTTMTHNNVTITGNGPDVTIVECEGGTGFGFININNTIISGLTLSGCGQLRNSTTNNNSSSSVLLFRAALYFENVINVSIDNVVVDNSIGMGVAMYDVTGNVTVNNSIFRNNSVPSYEAKIYPGGGGFSVEFTYCKPGMLNSSMCDNGTANNNASYSFINCTFEGNIATLVDDVKYSTVAFGINTPQFGRGGGLSVFFKGQAIQNTVTVDSSRFIRNSAIWGGGFLADFLDYSAGNNLTITDSSFSNNDCTYDRGVYAIGTGGGGVRIALHFYNQSLNDCSNYIEIIRCDFEGNSAYYGGGLSFSTVRQMCNLSWSISFQQCNWNGNTARTGSGVDLNVHTIPEGQVAPVYFRDCSFMNNSNDYVPEQPIYQLGIGSLYSDTVPVDFDGVCVFKLNNGGALAITGSRLTVQQNSSLSFENNTGHHGGAIALLGNAYIVVEENTKLKFYSNQAKAKGGAIYSLAPSQRDFVSTKKCFVYYKDPNVSPYYWNTSFVFINNTALSGNSIFVTTILPCVRDIPPGQTNVTERLIDEVLYWNGIFDYHNSSRALEISTEPLNVENVDDYTVILPGELFDLKLNPTDDKRNNTSAVFLVQTSTSNNVSVDDTSLYSSGRTVQLRGQPHTKFDVKLQTIGVRPLLVTFHAKLGRCPPGYYLDNVNNSVNKAVCKCSVYTNNSYHGISQCDEQENELVASLRPQIWAGYENDSDGDEVLLTGDCPDGYCFVNDSESRLLITLPSDSSAESLNSLLCEQRKRTGRLCGMCMEGHYIYINSLTYDCGKCDGTLSKYGALFIILLKFIPMTVFLCIIMFFNFSLVSGPLNAFILFGQILSAADLYAGGAIEPDHAGNGLKNFLIKSYQFLYGIWNLNFFETLTDHFCTFKYRSALPMLVLEYISAIYPLILFLLFFSILPWVLSKLSTSRIYFVQNCTLTLERICIRFRRGWSVKNSIIHGLITFLVLSYVKFTSVTWHILAYGIVYGPGGENSHISVRVAWVDGTEPYFGEVHGKYAAVACVVLVFFVLLAPLFLLLYPYLPKLLNKLKLDENRIIQRLLLRPLGHAIPFFDVIQGCFKDEYRFFAAFYFAYRVIAWAIFSFSTTVQIHYLWQLGFYTIILLIHSFCQPYKKRWHNMVDSLIFALLILINTISFYRFSGFVADLSSSPISFWFQLFLIYCPLAYFVGYMMKQCLKRCRPRVILIARQLSGRDPYQVIGTNNEDSAEFPARLYDSSRRGSAADDGNVELNNSTKWSNDTPNNATAAASECPSTIHNYGSTDQLHS